MSCIQQNFPSKFEPNDAFYEKLEQNTFVAFILKHPVEWDKLFNLSIHGLTKFRLGQKTFGYRFRMANIWIISADPKFFPQL